MHQTMLRIFVTTVALVAVAPLAAADQYGYRHDPYRDPYREPPPWIRAPRARAVLGVGGFGTIVARQHVLDLTLSGGTR